MAFVPGPGPHFHQEGGPGFLHEGGPWAERGAAAPGVPTLQIRPVIPEDAGNYTCRVDFRIGEEPFLS